MNDPRTKTPAGTSRSYRSVTSRKLLSPLLLVGMLGLLCYTTSFTPAQTTMEFIRWKEFSYAKQGSQVGGKIAGIDSINRSGFIVLGDGEFAQLSSSMVHTRSPEDKEFYQGFVMYDFDDGSSILAKVDVSGEPKSKQVGTIVFLAGTGRFKGISGRGTVYSWMPARWDMYVEIEASFSVAARDSDARETAPAR
ncbi:MAG: hypothetical protein JW741_07830 [Sedimentisphaerales bacterium]|nr:hypothetical protein [Sedimentisphaerales bacterium]